MPAQTLLEHEPGTNSTRARARIENREARLRRLGFKDYKAFLRSETWEETRASYWEDPDTLKVCGVCGTNDPSLPLHHRTYERVAAERTDDLIPLCNSCHHMVHDFERRGQLDGLDADLSGLTDPIRAARYRAQQKPREAPINPENKAQREKFKGLVRESELALEKSIQKDQPAYAIEARRRRLDKNRGKLRWLEQHPNHAMQRRGQSHIIPS